MAPIIKQSGSGARRNVILSFLYDGTSLQAVDPSAVIAFWKLPSGKYDELGNGFMPASLAAAVQEAITATGESFDTDNVIAAGFSEGCQGIRTFLRAGQVPDIVLAADGIHGSRPVPPASQIDPWRDLIAKAKACENVFSISHGNYLDTKNLSTTEMAELVTGWKVTDRGSLDAPSRLTEGCFSLYSVNSVDHAGEATKVLPIMLSDALAMKSHGSVADSGRLSHMPTWAVALGMLIAAGSVFVGIQKLREMGRI